MFKRVGAAACLVCVTASWASGQGVSTVPTSEVDWAESNQGWVSLWQPATLVPPINPEVASQRFLIGSADLFEVRYSRWSGATWVNATLSQGNLLPPFPDHVITNDRTRHLVYRESGAGPTTVVYRTSNDGINWTPPEDVAVPGLPVDGAFRPSAVSVSSTAVPYAAVHLRPAVGPDEVQVRRRVGQDNWVVDATLACPVGLPTLDFDAASDWHAACAGNGTVKYRRKLNGIVQPEESPFQGAAAPDLVRPAMVESNGVPHLVAFQNDLVAPIDQRLLFAYKPAGQGWVTKLVDNDAVRVGDVGDVVSSIAVPGDDSVRIAYIGKNHRIYYTEGSPLSNPAALSFSPPYLVDDSCSGLPTDSIRVQVDSAGNPQIAVWLDLFNNGGEAGPTGGVKYYHWKRPWNRSASFNDLSPTNAMTASTLTAAGLPVMCLIGGGGIGRLIVRRGLGAGWADVFPLGADIGVAPGVERGCAVATSASGALGLVYRDGPNNRVGYLTSANNGAAWVAGPQVWGTATGDLALAFDGPNGRAKVALATFVNGVKEVRYLELVNGAWVLDPAANTPGSMVALALDGEAQFDPRIAFINAQSRPAVRRRVLGNWQAVEVADNAAGLNAVDPAIDARKVNGTERLLLSYGDVAAGALYVRSRAPAGAWNLVNVDNGGAAMDAVGEYSGIRSDTFGHPIVTYLNQTQMKLRVMRYNRLAGFRLPGQAPDGAWNICDVQTGGRGTFLRLDPFDNPRASHKSRPASQHKPAWYSRP